LPRHAGRNFFALHDVPFASVTTPFLRVLGAVMSPPDAPTPGGAAAWARSTTAIEFNSRRACAMSTRGMVASSQNLATAAGMEILRKGGTAGEAAVAVAAALNVCEPTSTGIGGDAFALMYDAATKRVSAVQGGGASPAALTLELCRERGHVGTEILPSTDALCVVVPGAAAVWEDVVQRYGSGKLTMTDILRPAIELAEEGPPIGAVTAELWRRSEPLLAATGAKCMLTPDGRAPRAGERKPNPELAATFRRLAKHGARKGFYSGPIAEAIVAATSARGGVLALEDLAAHRTSYPAPMSTTYRDGIEVWELPPPNHGLSALLAMNLLEAQTPDGLGALDEGARAHAAVEAMRVAFADAMEHCGDPTHADASGPNRVPMNELIEKAYAKARVTETGLNPDSPCAGPEPRRAARGIRPSPDTVYFCVVDGDGNACSFINSNYDGFGTGIAPEGCGFTLQNRGHNFILEEGHVNCVGPRKRPYHTIIPGMATRAGTGDLFCAFGVMGGFMQPQGHLQVLSRMVDDDADPQTALDAPRWCLGGVGSERGAGSVLDAFVGVEEGGGENPWVIAERLEALGHKVERVSGLHRTLFGRGQIIARDENGVLWGGSDPRGDGCAMGI